MSRAISTADEAADALAEAIQNGEPLSPDAALRLRACGLPEAIGSALDYAPGAGKRLPETKALLARRDDLLKRIAKFYTGSGRARAVAIAEGWSRYATTAWPRDRDADACPRRHMGTPQAVHFDLMKLSLMPLSAESIRKIVGSEANLTLTHDSDDCGSLERGET